MGYMDEHRIAWEAPDGNTYFDKEKLNKAVRRSMLLDELHTEVKKFVFQSSLLVGADKIREILRKLDE